MARPEVTGRKPGANTVEGDSGQPEPPPLTPRLAFSIKQFCQAHSISEDFYYKLKRQRKNPREMLVGSRVLISIESAADWRREREAATANADQQMGA